jgi:hypothetical protein
VNLLTHTGKRTFRECQRKHHLMFDLGVRPRTTAEPLRFGTLMDDCCSEWDRTGHDLDAAMAITKSGVDPFESAKARALMRGYHERWCRVREEVLAVQPEFRIPLVNPRTGRASKLWLRAGKLDAIIRQGDRVMVRERKTTSEDITPGSDYWKRLRLDGQVSDYFDGGVSLGYDIEACDYDVIGKPGLRPLQVSQKRKTAETPLEYEVRILRSIAEEPSSYYGRATVVRLEKELEDARWDSWQIAKQMRAGQKDDHHPKNTEACTRFGTCPFFAYCTGQSALNDPQYRIVEKLHPELT